MNKVEPPIFLIVDLFAGFGGTSTGFMQAEIDGRKVAKVIAAVNHDPKAIKSHWLNHKEVKHFEEDIRTLDLTQLIALVKYWRGVYPEAYLVLFASLECTNFSKAKGGQARDADSRTLAEHLDRYINAINPDYIQIENVTEFMSWGPLDDKGKPISRKNGSDWLRWRNEINALGYRDEWKELNAANFGAYTSRNRLFGTFAKPHLPISWPHATHSKTPSKLGMYGDLKKWKAVKEVLDFTDEGESIFGRKKPLCDKTLSVIYEGAQKAIIEGESEFLFKYYGNGNNLNSINVPAGTLTTKDRFAKVKLTNIFRNYKSGFITSVDNPLGAIPTVPKAYLLSYILNLGHGGHTTSSNNPCPVIVARQDKAPLSLIAVFMSENGITDIKKRMLKVSELLKIQGFSENYQMAGTQTDHKKFIGNSVSPPVPKAMAECLGQSLLDLLIQKAA